MGTDIHSVAQVRKNDNWVTVDTTIDGDERNYELFGLLAGVRGWSSPISEPRGLPKDFEINSCQHSFYDQELLIEIFYIGEHSHSYYSLDELKKIYDKQTKPCVTCGRYDGDEVIRGDLTDVISHLDKIKNKYKVSDEDIRYVFGFDS